MATGSSGAEPHMARQEADDPCQVAPPPDGVEDHFDEYERVLAELCLLLGVDVPAQPVDNPRLRRGWRSRMRVVISRWRPRPLDDVIRELRRNWQNRMRTAVCRRLPRRSDEVIRHELPEGLAVDSLFEPLVRAAVYVPGESLNKHFLHPAVAMFGNRRVRTDLLQYLRDGNNYERAGAARAWIWAKPRLTYVVGSSAPTPESVAAVEALVDQTREFQKTALEVFVTSNDLEVRRSLIYLLDLTIQYWPEEQHELVHEALHIVRTHAKDLYT